MTVKRIRRVLLAWEFGGGMGHATRLLKVALALRLAGFIPIVAAANPQTLKERYQQHKITLIKAPEAKTNWNNQQAFKATSYSDILGIGGFADKTTLKNRIEQWIDILKKYQPDLIIADYAPILTLACYDRLPVICFGDGFVVPHAQQDSFPRLRKDCSRVWSEELLLENAISAIAPYTKTLPGCLPDIINGQSQVLSIIKELDIYGDSRDLAIGPLDKDIFPIPAAKKFHLCVYLSANHPSTSHILNVIAKHKLSADCLINGINVTAYKHWSSLGLNIVLKPPSIKETLSNATACIHHGGINLSEESILAGRFQFILPKHFEQRLNANRMLSQINSCIVASRKDLDSAIIEDVLLSELSHSHNWSKPLEKAVQVSKRPSSMINLVTQVERILY